VQKIRGVIPRGLAAGLVGGTALALWFLIIDGSRGIPFKTPAFLSSALLGYEEVVMSVGQILLFTFVHFGAFVLIGLGMSWLLTKIDTAPSVLLGIVLGFLLFNIVFYSSIYVTGVDVIDVLGWPEVLVGNLIAGLTIMGVLHMTGATRPVTWWEVLQEHQILREGLVAGLIGAGVVATWFLLFDLVQGRPFFTPAALGSALFLGASSLDDVTVNLLVVGGYTVLHVAAFLITGVLASAIVTASEETPPLILGAVLFFVVFEAFFLGLLAMAAEFLLGPLAWWTIAAGNLLAALTMGYYLWRKHPRLRAALAEDPLDKAA
jgi:hypothetical protein